MIKAYLLFNQVGNTREENEFFVLQVTFGVLKWGYFVMFFLLLDIIVNILLMQQLSLCPSVLTEADDWWFSLLGLSSLGSGVLRVIWMIPTAEAFWNLNQCLTLMWVRGDFLQCLPSQHDKSNGYAGESQRFRISQSVILTSVPAGLVIVGNLPNLSEPMSPFV